MDKITTITISDNKIPLNDYKYFWDNKYVFANCNDTIREILIRRSRNKDIPLLSIDNISNSLPYRIIDNNGNTILSLDEENFENNTQKAQIYLWILELINMSHSGFYKNQNCMWFVHMALWIDEPFVNWNPHHVDQSKFKISIIPSNLLGKTIFEIWDVIMLASESTLEKKDINLKTFEVNNDELLCKWQHFALYIWKGFFISKYWKFEKFCIWTLEEICEHYPSNFIFCIEKHKHIKSIYEESINEAILEKTKKEA